MKKFMLILIITLFSSIAFTQEPTEVSDYVTNSNVEKLVDKYVGEISATINDIIGTLEGPALKGWEIYVKQQIIRGWLMTGVFIIGLIVFIIGLVFGQRDDWDSEGFIAITVFGGVILFVGLILLFIECIPHIANPEYYAIQELLQLIH